MGKKRRSEQAPGNRDILYGINPVAEALKANRRRIHEIILAQGTDSQRLAEIDDLARKKKIPISRMNDQELSRISGTGFHQHVMAKVGAYPFADLSELIHPKAAVEPFVVILDGIEDPQNLGALARTALGAGVDGLIIPKDRAAQPTASASKASAGALEHISLVCVTNLVNTIKELKKEGFWITGLDADAPISLYDNDFSPATALVIGGEGRGVRELVRKNCDQLVNIPQKGPLNSLNASVAGALSMYEVVRQRQKQ